jgi:hypothetical protein
VNGRFTVIEADYTDDDLRDIAVIPERVSPRNVYSHRELNVER